MVKYEYDFDIMIKKIRKIWTPEDFLQATKNLMKAHQWILEMQLESLKMVNHFTAKDGTAKIFVSN